MRIRIEGTNLPGRSCGANGDFPGYGDIHVGVQRKDKPGEHLDLQPGDAESVVWEFEATPTPTESGVEFAGRYIQNRLGGRFIYLSWGSMTADGGFAMFRRAKLFLDGVDPETAAAAVASGVLVARLGLTDAKGNPLCAGVRPPLVAWSAGSGNSGSSGGSTGSNIAS